jgi:hypothetical protein
MLSFKSILLAVIVMLSFSACENSNNPVSNSEFTNDSTTIEQTAIKDLLQLYEEEKLARDVYLYAYQKWNDKIFNNIANSEQNHINAVKTILEQYKISHSELQEIGKFDNTELQTIYNELISKCDISLQEALTVGAIVEDLDINDLNIFATHTQNDTILEMYKNLNCGSRNHIVSFTSKLSKYNTEYTPQYISIELYNSIIDGSDNFCN